LEGGMLCNAGRMARLETMMSRNLRYGGRGRLGTLLLTTAALGFWVVGCAHYRVTEIDTTVARDFDWNGRVRITERTLENWGGFGPREPQREITRIELLGKGDRNVVIRPRDCARITAGSARLQPVGPAPDRYLVRLRTAIAEYQRAWETMFMLEPPRAGSWSAELRKKAWDEATAKFERVCDLIEKRDFEHLSGADLAFASAFRATQLESKYELDEHTIVRVRIEDDSLLTVTVEDKDGTVLHRYDPEELAVVEIEDG
jgi:hypothetical protein